MNVFLKFLSRKNRGIKFTHLNSYFPIMRDLFVLCLLIVFIIIAHSRTTPGHALSKTADTIKTAIPIQAASFGVGTSDRSNASAGKINEPAQKTKKYQKMNSSSQTDVIKIGKTGAQSGEEKCLVHSIHSSDNNFLCPYFPSQIISLEADNNASDQVLLVRYNN